MEKKQIDSMLEAFNDYSNLNLCAFPIRIWLERKGNTRVKKVKFDFNWKKVKPNSNYIYKLIESGRFNGLAIRTGQISNLFVLDIDIDKNEAKTNGLNLLREKGIKIPPETPCVVTQSGGYHFYFKFVSDPEFKSTGSCKQYKIDWRGENGIIFAPPTKISKYKKYKWKIKLTKENLLPPPDDLITWLKEHYYSADDFDLENYDGRKKLDDLSVKQKYLFEKLIYRSANAKVGERSEYDFDLIKFALKLKLSIDEIYYSVCDIGKFAEKGDYYFELTLYKAFNFLKRKEKENGMETTYGY